MKYKALPKIVEAVQFDGKNVAKIAALTNRKIWQYHEDLICIGEPQKVVCATKGQYVVKNGDAIEVMDAADFENRYEVLTDGEF